MQKEREKKGRPVDDVMGAMRKVVSEAFSMQTKLHVIDIDTSPVSGHRVSEFLPEHSLNRSAVDHVAKPHPATITPLQAMIASALCRTVRRQSKFHSCGETRFSVW